MTTKHCAKIYGWTETDANIIKSIFVKHLEKLGLSEFVEVLAFGTEDPDQGPQPLVSKYVGRPAIAFYAKDGRYLGVREFFVRDENNKQVGSIRMESISNWLIGLMQIASGQKPS